MVSRYERLPDSTYIEHADDGWMGTSTRQHGLVTGRPSPTARNADNWRASQRAQDKPDVGPPPPIDAQRRVRPVTALMRGHEDLTTETDIAGHGHGVLFNPAPYVRQPADVLREAGVPQRRPSSGEGFLPRLGSVAGETDPEKRAAVVADKRETLSHAGKITRPVHVADSSKPPEFGTNADLGELGTSTPMATQMQNRAQFVHSSVQGDWYKTESDQVNDAATRAGVAHGVMRRAVAYASPKTPWNTGHPQDANVKYPNLNAAEAVVTHVTNERKNAADQGRGFDPVTTALDTRTPTVSGEGERMPAFTRVMRVIGESMQEGHSPADRITTQSEIKNPRNMTGEKVPNFDLALARGSASKTARREASQAYTSDVWDTRTAGLNDYSHIAGGGLTPPGGTQRRTGGDKDLVDSRPRGQYDVVATTGRRAGMKAGMLPSEMQQHIWRSGRGNNGVAEPEQSMFNHSEGMEWVNTQHVERTGARHKIDPGHEAWLDKNDDF